MSGLLKFEWERAAEGYTVVDFEPDDVDLDAGINEDGELSLKDGASFAMAHLVALIGTDPIAKKKTSFLVPRGWATTQSRPLDDHPALFREFADTGQSEEGVNRFADKFGLLTASNPVSKVTDWYREIRAMRKAIRTWNDGKQRGDLTRLIKIFDEQVKGRTAVKLGKAWEVDQLALHIVPETLLSAIWLQFAQAVSVNTLLRQCALCSTWFTYGSGTGRRKSAHFCSSRCQKAAWKKRKEAER